MANWFSAAKTHKGKIRRVNEDSLMRLNSQGFWAVADGMGGHAAGDYASQLITSRFSQFVLRGKSLDDIACLLDTSLNELNDTMLEYAKDYEASAVGSTVVSLALGDHGVGLAHWVGDSRIYRLRAGKLKLISHDHSLIQELVDLGQISAKDAEHYPSKNVITRAVGAGKQVCSEYKVVDYVAGDIYLLCSDGLTNEVNDSAIEELLQRIIDTDSTAEQKTNAQHLLDDGAESLLNAALKHMAADNISFVLVWVTD